MPMRHLVRDLVDAVDPDTQAQVLADAIDPETAIQELLDTAVKPLASNPGLRQRILELRATHDRIIDTISVDVLLDAHGVVDTARARPIVESWQQYLIDHRDEITAIQLMQEAKERQVSFAEIQALADRISRPPHNWTPDLIWSAYEAIELAASGTATSTPSPTWYPSSGSPPSLTMSSCPTPSRSISGMPGGLPSSHRPVLRSAPLNDGGSTRWWR
jgi:hypothetical protein